jgi:predicted MFS family arabinose efflux permease
VAASGSSRYPLGAMAVLIAMRVIYAYNWFDIGPGLPEVGREFGVPTAWWGLLLSAFFAGAGALQVPAGLLARRWGTRSVSLLGAGLLGGAAFLCALAPDFWVLVAFRCAAGAGAGLFFSPAIALVSSLHPEGQRGVPVGIFSSAFAAGAGLGTFVPALLIPAVGWQVSLAIGGAMMLVLLGLGIAVIPRSAGAAPMVPPKLSRPLPKPLRTPGVWAIGFAFVGLEGASLSSGQYFVPYAQEVLGWSAALAGAVGALFVFPSLFGGPVGGRLTERFTNRRTQMFVFTAIPCLLLALVPWAGVLGIAAIATAFSFTFGAVYAMMYVIPPYLPGLTQEDVPLAIGLLNGVQLAGGATVAFVAGWVISAYGYARVWPTLALLVLVPLVFLLAVPVSGRAQVPGPSGS